MQCDKATTLIDDYLDGYLDGALERELTDHLAGCPQCRAELQRRQELLVQLRAIPVPAASPGFSQRVLRHARHGHHSRVGFATGFGSAIAAGLLVWFVVGLWQPATTPEPGGLSVITMRLSQPREVSLAFNVPQAINDVTFRIELPEGVELQGYPSQRELVWQDRLNQGRNIMNLKLIAKQGAEGELLAHIKHGDKERVFRIPVKTSINGAGILPLPARGNVLI
jgi:hypothetical protein